MNNQSMILELNNISKFFPGVKALDNVSINLMEGEILALVGENGAGKSTLIKIITGVYQPDEGEIKIFDKKVEMSNPRDAFRSGISAVHQERNLISTFTVAENIMLDRMSGKSTSIINLKEIVNEAKKYLSMVELDVSLYANVETLNPGQKQLLEIARALALETKIVMLDEPTASISVRDSIILMNILKKLKNKGFSFIYVSHKLEEVFEIADRVCVIRDGRNTEDICSINDLDRDKLITLMVGRKESKQTYPERDMTNGEIIIEANNILSKANNNPGSFNLHKGEILGWYGLVGSGRTELAREIIGIDPVISGELTINKKKLTVHSTHEALDKLNLAYISEDRNEEGLFLTHSIKKNIASSVWQRITSKFGIVDQKREIELAFKYKDRLAIKTTNIQQYVNFLSGGNRQKVSIAKGLATDPEILIIDEPTVGIDVNTKEEIHKLIWDLALDGISVILISSDMPELIKLADRINVFSEGSICGNFINTKMYTEMSKKIMELIVKGQVK